MSNSKKTPLYEEHLLLNAKMVDFAGWQMPVEYEGLRKEHLSCRQSGGLFDVSHMGEIRVKGPNSLKTLEWLTSNWVEKLEPGQAQYSLLTTFEGGVVDDLIIYCFEKGQDYLLCVNASNTDKDLSWILENNKGAEIINESDNWSQIALQGPFALEISKKIWGDKVANLKSFEFAPVDYNNEVCYFARTGYTGEEGFEIFVPNSQAQSLWKKFLEMGGPLGVKPVGLGARDTLRTEMKYPLYGHELNDLTNPYEAGLGWVVKPDKKDFIGKDKIMSVKEKGLKQKLVGFVMVDRGIARQGYGLFSFDNQEIGKVTSGTVSPSLETNIGIGYVDVSFAEVGTEIGVNIRGKLLKAKVVKTPFVIKN